MNHNFKKINEPDPLAVTVEKCLKCGIYKNTFGNYVWYDLRSKIIAACNDRYSGQIPSCSEIKFGSLLK